MDATTSQRLEMKYLIPEAKACAIAAFIQSFVVRDRHSKAGAEYPVWNVYLDAPDLCLYRSSVCGERNRFKLRVRTYAGNGTVPVFFEIKRRIDQVIRKERALVKQSEADGFLHDSAMPPENGTPRSGKEVLALYNFRELRETLAAKPRVCVSYLREAYVGALEEPVRITFDRDVECIPVPERVCCWHHSTAVPFRAIPTGVVLEIKFTDACPCWVRDVVRRFDLERQSVSKYVLGVNALKRGGVPLGGLTGGRVA